MLDSGVQLATCEGSEAGALSFRLDCVGLWVKDTNDLPSRKLEFQRKQPYVTTKDQNPNTSKYWFCNYAKKKKKKHSDYLNPQP